MIPTEIEYKHKAGIIPFCIIDGEMKMLFMMPSDSKFGGSKFQIAKGNIDDGENSLAAALREGNEELGLIKSNLKNIRKLVTQKLTGLDETYIITVYAAEVKDPGNFDQPHYETASTRWMTVEEFRTIGRLSHLPIVQMV